MKVLIRAILLATLIAQGAVYAHQGHGEINDEDALNIASKSVKQQTFKDFGYAIGKLDASWKSSNNVHFSVLEVLDEAYIVSATNATNNKVIYFEITIDGNIIGVKNTR